MLHIVGNVFLYGISFNIKYNKLGHKNMTNFEHLLFTEFWKNINLLKTEMDGHEPALCCHTYIYLLNMQDAISYLSMYAKSHLK